MNNEEQFEQLKKLLALKKYEQPPPGYFDRLSRQIIAAVEADRNARRSWFSEFWHSLQSKPSFGGALAIGMCGLIAAGIFLSGKVDETPGKNGNVAVIPKTDPIAMLLTEAENSSTNPIATAQPPPFLFNASLVSSGGLQQPVNLEVHPR